jgi:L-fuconolactonase
VKVTGFFYGTDRPWEYPLPHAVEVVHRFCDAWGPDRLLWGSESPNFRAHLSYRQTLEIVRTHCSFIPGAAMDMVLGGNLDALLRAGPFRRGSL